MNWEQDRWAERCRLVYLAQMNRLYHQRHERFLALADRGAKAFALVLGSAAASTLLPTAEMKAWAGAAVACVSLPSLVFAWADRARLHAEFSAAYTRLEAEIIAAGVLTWEQLDAFEARLTETGAKEPAALASLLVSCQNELAIAAGQPQKVAPLGWRRAFLHVFSMPLEDAVKPFEPPAAGPTPTSAN